MSKLSKDGDNRPKSGLFAAIAFGSKKKSKEGFNDKKIAARVGLPPYAPSAVSNNPAASGKPDVKETSTSSANTQLIRGKGSQKKKSTLPFKQSARARGSMKFMGSLTAQLMEAGAQSDATKGRRFRVTLLQEGLGNFENSFYYTAEAIRSAVPLYEGSKAFMDHPAESEERDRPERSIKDIFGYFENVGIHLDDDGRNSLVADLVTIIDPNSTHARTLLLESLSYSTSHPGQALIGLSINASGDFKTLPIDQFLSEVPMPDSCKSKVLEAKQRGVTMVRPVLEMKTAVSCDLVTTAGAGGSINQLLEGNKSMGKEAKEMEEGFDLKAGKDDADGAADGQTGDHPDAAQDEELIMSMLKKYLGDGFSDDDKSMAKEAYQNAREMGLEGKEAETCAGHNMKMAKHLQAKAAAMPEAGKIDDAAVKTHSPNPVSSGAAPKDEQHAESAKKDEECKESNKQVKIMAENARLRQELDAMKLKEHTEKVLRESKLPMAATKKFRECLVGAKSIKEVDEKLALFKEAFSIRGESSEDGFIFSVEKTEPQFESGSLDFSDCKSE